MSEKRVATIYDFNRYVKAHDSVMITDDSIDSLNDTILKWCDEHPVKTRLTEFKKLFPGAALEANGYPSVCLLDINPRYRCNLMCSDQMATCNTFWDEELE